MKYLGTVKFEGTDFDCYGTFSEPDDPVHFNGSIDLEDVKVAGFTVFEALKPTLITHFEDELHYELSYSRGYVY